WLAEPTGITSVFAWRLADGCERLLCFNPLKLLPREALCRDVCDPGTHRLTPRRVCSLCSQCPSGDLRLGARNWRQIPARCAPIPWKVLTAKQDLSWRFPALAMESSPPLRRGQVHRGD